MRRPPRSKRHAPAFGECAAYPADEVSLGVEGVVDGSVDREEPLG